jgi:hypothetical protein
MPIQWSELARRTVSDPVAFFTFWLALFTLVLTAVSIYQGWQQRREFVATFRPRLVVRELEYMPRERGDQIEFTVANVGGSRATVSEWNCTAYTNVKNTALAAHPPYETDRTVHEKVKLTPGETLRLKYIEGTDVTLMLGEVMARNVDLFIIGYVLYGDGIGIVRRTSFCREYVRETKRFRTAADPDYEFAD